MLAEAAGPDQHAAKNIFLPHTNTVILLEPYRGTITEPGLPVVIRLRLESIPSVFPGVIRENCFSVVLLWAKTTI